MSADSLTERLEAVMSGRAEGNHGVSQVIEIAQKSLQTLLEIHEDIKQLLQLRYQNVGYNVLEEALGARIHRILGRRRMRGGQQVIELKASNQNLSNVSPVLFQVGRRVIHKIHKYRGVVIGWDQRPLVNVKYVAFAVNSKSCFILISEWPDVMNSELKSEQPFYKIMADESDIKRSFGNGTYSKYYYIPQEHLDLCEDEYVPYNR